MLEVLLTYYWKACNELLFFFTFIVSLRACSQHGAMITPSITPWMRYSKSSGATSLWIDVFLSASQSLFFFFNIHFNLRRAQTDLVQRGLWTAIYEWITILIKLHHRSTSGWKMWSETTQSWSPPPCMDKPLKSETSHCWRWNLAFLIQLCPTLSENGRF